MPLISCYEICNSPRSIVCKLRNLRQTDVAVFLMERGADVTNVEDVNENGPLDLCSGRAATRKYDGLPHQVCRSRRAAVATMEASKRQQARKQARYVDVDAWTRGDTGAGCGR